MFAGAVAICGHVVDTRNRSMRDQAPAEPLLSTHWRWDGLARPCADRVEWWVRPRKRLSTGLSGPVVGLDVSPREPPKADIAE